MQVTAELSIDGVYIPAYKNLSNVWLPWSSGLSLVGRNGAGKTNVLEALALLLGDEETLRLCADRLDTAAAPGQSVIVRADLDGLPVGPSTLAGSDFSSLGLRGEQLTRDIAWWSTEGVPGGDTFADALATWDLPDDLRAACAAAIRSPIMQYTLVGIAQDDDDPGQVQRLYRRTLLTGLPLEVSSPPSSPAFSPLGTSIGGPTGLTALLELPLTNHLPAVLQWLPRQRTEEEVMDSLQAAFAEGLGPVEGFVELLSESMPSRVDLDPPDAHWWLHKFGEAVANGELQRTSPSLYLDSEGGSNADWAFWAVQDAGRHVNVGHSFEEPLQHFSSGQRRWLDEALATVSRALRNIGQRAKLLSMGLSELEETALIDHVLPGIELAETEGFWSAEALDSIMRSLDRVLIGIASATYPAAPARRALIRAALPFYGQLDRQIVVRVIDEPEAHLHVTAQRQVATAVQSMRNEGQNIVLATHSPAFLEFANWQTIHISNGSLSTVTAMDLRSRHRLARELGLTQGELLATVAMVLAVEGAHDQLVLDTLYGAELRQAGIAIVRMFGTDNLPDLLSLDFIERYVDAPVAVMLDYTKTDRVDANRPRTDEERKLVALRKAAKRKGMSFHAIGLAHPDIVCYLNEQAVRRGNPGFPGWSPILRRFKEIRWRPSFKPWLQQDYGVDLTHSGRIREVLDIMVAERLPPGQELHQKVSELLAARS